MSNKREIKSSMNKISESDFTIVSNGYADGPSQALRDYVVGHKASRVVTVAHPLVAGGDDMHIISSYIDGNVTHKRIRLINRPPYTYIFDLFVPFSLKQDTVWFGFNNLACLRGLVRKKFGRSQKVVYWAVDFVPNRFGKGFATWVYNAVDRFVCEHADVRVELTQEALEARASYLKLKPLKLAPSMVVPMGAWLSRTPKVSGDALRKKKIVYMGHIVERQGVAHIIRAMSILTKNDVEVTLDIVGGGPDEPEMKRLATELGLTKHISFRGFVEDHKDVERYLSEATIAVAPYTKVSSNFTVTSDPGKVKAYLGASLPIVLTDVPPIAKILEARGVALLVEDTPESIAQGIERYLHNEDLWSNARKASAKMAKDYDWESILANKLREMGIK
jgi:glycosyltransferase involved in cell wall biosynthesis